ncbi:MAG: DUF308 domain-containing protein [Planctomycetaceae bacterium]|jgi:hypothetical protein|nr:DUF308 domain-containing protein [Planctomycetaceae bacterium]
MGTIDYKRCNSYFNNNGSIGLGIVLIIVGILLLFIFIGIIPLAIGIWKIYLAVTRPKDEEIDQMCKDHIRNITSVALSKLGIDEDQVKEANPVIVAGYYYGDGFGEMSFAVGKDGVTRTSAYNAVVFFFSTDQIFRYSYSFSLLKNDDNANTGEVFYGDVVSVACSEDSYGMGSPAATANGQTKVKYQKFVLTTTGGTTMSATFSNRSRDMSAIEQSVNAMRSLLRGKKQHLQR